MIRSRIALAITLAGLALGGCSGTDAALITVTGTVTGVYHLDVALKTQNGLHMESVSTPMPEGAALTWPKTLSLTFPSTVAGYLLVHVDGKVGSTTVAKGDGFAAIAKGDVTQVTVPLTPFVDTTPTDMGGAHD